MKSPIVRVDTGEVVGSSTSDGEVFSFKGVPYAAPPVGDLRWKAPMPRQRWTGTRPAQTFGPRCPQPDHPRNSIMYFGTEAESEDCLYLNLWTPAPERGARLPVMVWLHGGGFLTGSGAEPIFNGEALARRGVVIVTLNYRLGALGFMSHPALQSGTALEPRGNWGLLDQIAALQWLQRNVDQFGGDPSCVTIFGQSAGSSSVNCLMASPLARGLFHRAIGQSGGSVAPPGRPGGGSLMDIGDAERVAERVCSRMGLRSAGDLRSASAQDLQLRWPRDRAERCWATIDGQVIPRDVGAIFRDGEQIDVPLLTGATANEGAVRSPAPSVDAWKQVLRRDFGEEGLRLFAAYGSGENYSDMSRRLGGHLTFNWINWTWARLHKRTATSKVFAYRFSQVPPIPATAAFSENDSARFGAFHTSEIPYVFGTLDVRDWAWTDEDRALSQTMISYWTQFAANGDPNTGTLGGWDVFDPDRPSIRMLEHGASMGELPERELFDLIDNCMERLEREGRDSLAPRD